MADVANITATMPGANGTFFRAPIGAPLPTDAYSDLDSAFVDQGIVGESGVSQTLTRSTEDIKAYGGEPVYTLQTEYGTEFTVTVYESMNAETLKTVFGDNNVIESGDSITVRHNKTRLPRSTFVFDHIIDQGLHRQVIPIGQIVSVGDISKSHTGIIQYELTLKTYPDANGDFIIDYYYEGETNTLGVATGLLLPATEGQEYSAQLQAAGGTAPYTWAAVGALPAGLELSATGVLSGTPTAPDEDASVTVKVTDADSREHQKTLNLTIKAAAVGDS